MQKTNDTFQVVFLEDHSIISLPKPEILALDLDLTLHNVIKHYDESVNETLKHFGYECLTQEQLQSSSDNFTNTKDLFAKLVLREQLDAAVEYYTNHFVSREVPMRAIIPGAKELLYVIKKRFNLPIIGVTNSEENIAKKILSDLGALNSFDYIIGIKDEYLPKPDAQMLLIALASIGAKPGPHVWFMGDRASDTQCAKRVNCTAIRFYHKIKPQDPNADLFINSHYHLFNIIETKLKL